MKGTMGKNSDESENGNVRYWVYAPGENAWFWERCLKKGYMAIGWDEVGDLSTYDSKEKIKKQLERKFDRTKDQSKNAYQCWSFAHEIKKGDIVFVKDGLSKIIGRGIVESDYKYDQKMGIETKQGLYYRGIRKVQWTHVGEWSYCSSSSDTKAARQTIREITKKKDKVRYFNSLFDDYTDQNKYKVSDNSNESYSPASFLKDVYINKEDFETLTTLLKRNKNIILQGAPGTGKTYAAKRLAYAMMGKKDDTRVKMVQFHQSYSYEDFIMGFRPKGGEDGFVLNEGVFYKFCKEAEKHSDNEYFFIIDEINRGNLSRIFGELFMLIENDKRGEKLNLLYKDEEFSVPENLYIIGLMNTADRSLAMLDYALRRRFAFFDMIPAFENENFSKYQKSCDSTKFDNLIKHITALNKQISEDESLGAGFQIGHSFFCNLDKGNLDKILRRIVKYEIIPLLSEYWFDEPKKIEAWKEKLISCVE